jgi:4,5-dihydroxyphthalate decarboxylase
VTASLELSLALSDNARTRPLLEGRAGVEGVRLEPQMLHPSEMFWRQLHHAEFDVSEMSISSLLILAAAGRRDWTALPVFTMRRFFHTSIMVRKDAGIERPEDLVGKRVGVPEYQQTWAVWSRGVLMDEFGVRPEQMTWFMERGGDRSHGAATGFTAPPGVEVHAVPPETDIGEMLVRGEIDATLLYLNRPNLVDRGKVDLAASDAVRPLFADPEAEGRRYYAKTGIFPINHLVVVRTSLVELHPWLPLHLYAAFAEAKAMAEAAGDGSFPHPAPYGTLANRPVLETIARYVHDQGLAPRQVALEEIFPADMLAV